MYWIIFYDYLSAQNQDQQFSNLNTSLVHCNIRPQLFLDYGSNSDNGRTKKNINGFGCDYKM